MSNSISNIQQKPGLFGVNNSNRDFSDSECWGKNQFNSSFPAALCCYMASIGLGANYINYSEGKLTISELELSKIFGIQLNNPSIYFGFETPFIAYQQYIIGSLPRTDLVISTIGHSPAQISAFEIKLTALPDNSTCQLGDDAYGSELVVRPDTIYYLSAALAHQNMPIIRKILDDNPIINNDWAEPSSLINVFGLIVKVLKSVLNSSEIVSCPMLLQPIWKTNGKKPMLAENCLDVFAWSTTGFLYFLVNNCNRANASSVTRPMRTLAWVYLMLHDIATKGATNFSHLIDIYSYNTKNDKAFAANGSVTNAYMKCSNLTAPRVGKDAVKNIILGGGQNYLSPERRFDSIIVNSLDLFA